MCLRYIKERTIIKMILAKRLAAVSSAVLMMAAPVSNTVMNAGISASAAGIAAS